MIEILFRSKEETRKQLDESETSTHIDIDDIVQSWKQTGMLKANAKLYVLPMASTSYYILLD